jgi:hypothetical protein
MKTRYTLCGISALALASFAFAAPVSAQVAAGDISKLPIADVPYEQITSFEQIRLNWVRRAQEGNIMRTFTPHVLQTWEPAAPLFTPEPGGVYVYENTGREKYQQVWPCRGDRRQNLQGSRQQRAGPRSCRFGAHHRRFA